MFKKVTVILKKYSLLVAAVGFLLFFAFKIFIWVPKDLVVTPKLQNYSLKVGDKYVNIHLAGSDSRYKNIFDSEFKNEDGITLDNSGPHYPVGPGSVLQLLLMTPNTIGTLTEPKTETIGETTVKRTCQEKQTYLLRKNFSLDAVSCKSEYFSPITVLRDSNTRAFCVDKIDASNYLVFRYSLLPVSTNGNACDVLKEINYAGASISK